MRVSRIPVIVVLLAVLLAGTSAAFAQAPAPAPAPAPELTRAQMREFLLKAKIVKSKASARASLTPIA